MLPPHDVERHRDVGSRLVEAKLVEPAKQGQRVAMQLAQLVPPFFELSSLRHHLSAYAPLQPIKR
jgi:hypothetical protein